MTPLRLAVIGCGSVSLTCHLPAIRSCPEVELVAVVDVDGDWAARVARRFGARHASTDYTSLVGLADAVIVATPNATHADVAGFCLQHGIHVLCEKPVATTGASARRMFDVALAHDTRCMAAHCLRFAKNIQAAKRLFDCGTLTRPLTITGSLGKAYRADAYRTDFRRNAQLAGGGVLIDLGVHLIDLSIWLAADHPTVAAVTLVDRLEWGVEHDADLTLAFPNGSTARLACSYTKPGNPAFRLETADGWTVPSFENHSELQLYSPRAPVCRRDGAQRLLIPDPGAYVTQLRHFASSILTRKPFAVQTDEVLAGMDVVDECYTQWRTETCQSEERNLLQAPAAS